VLFNAVYAITASKISDMGFDCAEIVIFKVLSHLLETNAVLFPTQGVYALFHPEYLAKEHSFIFSVCRNIKYKCVKGSMEFFRIL
jgi:hypothetical protein